MSRNWIVQVIDLDSDDDRLYGPFTEEAARKLSADLGSHSRDTLTVIALPMRTWTRHERTEFFRWRDELLTAAADNNRQPCDAPV